MQLFSDKCEKEDLSYNYNTNLVWLNEIQKTISLRRYCVDKLNNKRKTQTSLAIKFSFWSNGQNGQINILIMFVIGSTYYILPKKN